jgi:hypothetical protein
MFESAKEYSILYQCYDNESYESIVDRGEDPTHHTSPKGCGSQPFAVTFHLLFQIIVGQIFLNLFIAVIIDSFFGTNDAANLPVSERAIETFPTIWSRYDPEKTGFIPCNQLENLLEDIARDEDCKDLVMFPTKVADEHNKEGEITKDNSVYRRRLIMMLDIPTYDKFQKVLFYDVIQ